MWRAQKELNQLRKEEKGPVGTYRGSAKSLAAMATREEDGEGVGEWSTCLEAALWAAGGLCLQEPGPGLRVERLN